MDPKQIDVYIVDAESVAGMTKHPPLQVQPLVARGQLEGRHVCVKGEMVIHNGKLD